MAKVVEPPILLSRMLTFVLATSIVVLGALVITLAKMIPLERPEVFFLFTPTRATNVVIEPMTPDATNEFTVETYKEGFIRQYIIARNTLGIGRDAIMTRNNWDKIVRPWSDKKVLEEFTQTNLYKQYRLNDFLPTISCAVNFQQVNNDLPILKTDDNNDIYEVKFTWVCKNENIGGQTTQKNYKIRIRIQSDLDKKLSGLVNQLEKMRDNPLGIQVVEYTVKGGADPLNSDVESW